jgi:hypothetical protein
VDEGASRGVVAPSISPTVAEVQTKWLASPLVVGFVKSLSLPELQEWNKYVVTGSTDLNQFQQEMMSRKQILDETNQADQRRIKNEQAHNRRPLMSDSIAADAIQQARRQRQTVKEQAERQRAEVDARWKATNEIVAAQNAAKQAQDFLRGSLAVSQGAPQEFLRGLFRGSWVLLGASRDLWDPLGSFHEPSLMEPLGAPGAAGGDQSPKRIPWGFPCRLHQVRCQQGPLPVPEGPPRGPWGIRVDVRVCQVP